MHQVDFELARREFRSSGIGRNALRIAVSVEVVQEMIDLPQVIRMVNLRTHLRPAEAGHACRAWRGLVGFRIQQVELEFRRHDDSETHLVEWLQRVLDHRPRVGKEPVAICIMHAE